jgi:uncharacterized protein (DUF58 family)
MITGKGVGFLIAAVGLFFLGRLTQVGWLYLMDAVLWGIVLLSAVLPWLNVPFLEVRRRLEHAGDAAGRDGPAEGERIDIEVSLENRSFWPRFFLTLYYHCPLAGPDARRTRFFLGQLSGWGQTSLSSSVVAHRRGRHRLGPVVVESSAPFGLFRRRVRLAPEQEVLVYPRLIPLKRLALVDGLAGAALQRRKSRVGMEIAGSRPYSPGDPRRHIHWRNTARAGRPMVKEFEDPRDQTLCLLFDATREWGEDRDTTLEYGIKVAAGVADYARAHQVSVRLWGGGFAGETLGGRGSGGPEAGIPMSWTQVLRSLALLEAGEGPTLADSLAQTPPGSSALVVISAGDEAGVRALGPAAARLHRLIVVVLEGFAGTKEHAGTLDALEARGLPVVRCRPGRLEEALNALEGLGEPGPRSVRVA